MRSLYILSAVFFIVLATGCAPKIPADVTTRVTWEGAFETLQADPMAYENEFLILGGKILSTENYESQSVITVLQYPLDNAGRPRPEKESGGRFLIRSGAFADPEIYVPGKLVTVAGKVTGEEQHPIGEFQYRHPVIEGKLYLWEAQRGPAPRFQFGIGIGKTF